MRRLLLAFLLVAAGNGVVQADDGDVTVVGGVDVGFKDFSLEINRNLSSYSPSFVTINPTLVLGYKSFYTSLSYDKSITADTGSSTAQSGDRTLANTTEFARVDSTFTVGYRLSPFNFFFGYTDGTSKFTETTFDSVFIVATTEYTETGPFGGMTYTKMFSDTGNLVLSIAYAQLEGNLEIFTRPSGSFFRANGDSTGLSYGLTWTGPLTGSLGYRVGFKITEYEMTEPVGIIEKYTNFFIGIANYF
ncbi:MAG: hypothetical protein HY308_16370 [Gammaproteobacteria bacterium]|nr:hypothetical protein [Gammaproteobacteria bacterium]